MSNGAPAFIGLDLETTGLNPETNTILELGIVLFDDALQSIAAQSWLTVDADGLDAVYSEMDSTVVAMHTTNGLIQEIKTVDRRWYIPTITPEAHIRRFLLKHGITAPLPMLGSSVSFDRACLHAQYPELLQFFTHQSVDARSIQLAHIALTPPDQRPVHERFIHGQTQALRDDVAQECVGRWRMVPHRPIYDLLTSGALIHATHAARAGE